LLIDEDTCATNFMIRDDKMMQLVATDKEPITPFVRIVRSLYDDKGISTILVVGAVGDYFDVADIVVTMDCYNCLDVTERAKQIVANSMGTSYPHTASAGVPFRPIQPRKLVGTAFSANGKVKVSSQHTISYGEAQLDLAGLEQLVTKSQTSAVANALQQIPGISNHDHSLPAVLAALDQQINAGGLDTLAPGQYHGGMSRPRALEIAGALNRLRTRENSIVVQPN
jgi:predicted ABC-class ATPase